MRRYQKVVISILSIMVVAVAGITIYAMQVLGDANSMMDNISQAVNRTTQKRDVAMSIEERDPFSILLLGIDTGALGRTEQGRSDSMMVVTINPEKKQSTIVSLDRDIYADMLDGVTFDKLNHAYAYGGAELAMDAVENSSIFQLTTMLVSTCRGCVILLMQSVALKSITKLNLP